LRTPCVHGNVFAVEHLEQRDTLGRISGDGNDHCGGQGSLMAATSTCVVDEQCRERAVGCHVSEVEPQG
jgi:hypothetical protein